MNDYKKILKGVVNIINTTEKSDIGFANICTYIGENCPELKESEDERIRKGIIEYLKCRISDEKYGDKYTDKVLERWIAWLEKQGESSDQIHYWTEEEIEPIISDYLRGAEHYGGMIGRLRCLKPKSLEKQGEKSLTVDIESMIEAYEQRLINQGNGVRNSPIVNMCVAAFKHGVENTLDELHLKQGEPSVKWNKNTEGNKPQVNHSVLMKTTHGVAEGEWKGEYWLQYRWSGSVKDSDVLSWMELSDLEKQGEQKPIDYNDELKKCRENPLYFFDKYVKLEERKSTDKVEPKFKIGDEIKTANEEPLTITKIDEKGYWSEDLFICGFDEECCWDLVEQKPDWNKEDKEMFDKIRSIVEKYAFSQSAVDVNGNLCEKEYIEADNWLKSLKNRVLPQPKQEWSEEDEVMIKVFDSIIRYIIVEVVDKDALERFGTNREELFSWLKSLKQRIGG